MQRSDSGVADLEALTLAEVAARSLVVLCTVCVGIPVAPVYMYLPLNLSGAFAQGAHDCRSICLNLTLNALVTAVSDT
jgi:hypothetical protein